MTSAYKSREQRGLSKTSDLTHRVVVSCVRSDVPL
jgi:hypothetical protein